MAGPLPSQTRRRRNVPTIPTTSLPASGRAGKAPSPPRWVKLGPAGLAWWRWAWKTPQAAAWANGTEVVVARRASLEDDLAAVDVGLNLDVADLVDVEPNEATATVEAAFRALARLAGGKIAVAREARELDRVLGMTPKAMAELRWQIVDDSPAARRPSTPSLAVVPERWKSAVV
jgi:hypothetical protein